MNLNMSVIGWLHSIGCLYAMVVGALVLFNNKGGAQHRKRGQHYVIAMAVVNLSALAIFTSRGFGVFHWMAVFTLACTAIAFVTAYWKRPKGSWLRVHFTAVLLSYYMLWGGVVNEAFLRIAFMHKHSSSAAIAFTHSLFMIIALMAIAYFWGKTSKPFALEMNIKSSHPTSIEATS